MKSKIKAIIGIIAFIILVFSANAFLKYVENMEMEKDNINSENVGNNESEEGTKPENGGLGTNQENNNLEGKNEEINSGNNNNENSEESSDNNISNEETKTDDEFVEEITNENFDEKVLKSDKKVLIDFYATWCIPCKRMAPILLEYAKSNEEIKIVKIDVDKEIKLAEKYGITSMPTLVVIENGEEVDRHVGYLNKNSLNEFMK